jgi:hypothetical protein
MRRNSHQLPQVTTAQVQRRPYPGKSQRAQSISLYMIVLVRLRVSYAQPLASNSLEMKP